MKDSQTRPGLLRRFGEAREGALSMILALGLPGVVALIAGAVDYTAMMQSQSRLQAAADAAALAVAREMTITSVTPDRVQVLARSYALANLGEDGEGVTVQGTLAEGGMAAKVYLSGPIRAPLGFFAHLSGTDTQTASAMARVSASTAKTKLCVLSLGEFTSGGIFMHNGSRMTAPDCMLHSNSIRNTAVIVQQGSQLVANMVCARGGISNQAGTLNASLVTDCPAQSNPFDTKPEPLVTGSCKDSKVALKSGQHTLQPGIYCKGVTIEGSAIVNLEPGVYVFRDGPLVVRGSAQLAGNGVTLMFAGKRAYFRFLENSLIQISAPTTGISAGMLVWESRQFVKGRNSWQDGGCGGNGDDEDDDAGSNTCGNPQPGVTPPKKTNEHHINSDRARQLTGTIYLRNGMLLIDSRMPVADQSPFTVIVVNKLDLYDGPNLVLNSNYNASPVPVPSGLGPLGGTRIRLGV